MTLLSALFLLAHAAATASAAKDCDCTIFRYEASKNCAGVPMSDQFTNGAETCFANSGVSFAVDRTCDSISGWAGSICEGTAAGTINDNVLTSCITIGERSFNFICSPKAENLGWIAGIVVPVFCLLCYVILCLTACVIRRRRQNRMKQFAPIHDPRYYATVTAPPQMGVPMEMQMGTVPPPPFLPPVGATVFQPPHMGPVSNPFGPPYAVPMNNIPPFQGVFPGLPPFQGAPFQGMVTPPFQGPFQGTVAQPFQGAMAQPFQGQPFQGTVAQPFQGAPAQGTVAQPSMSV